MGKRRKKSRKLIPLFLIGMSFFVVVGLIYLFFLLSNTSMTNLSYHFRSENAYSSPDPSEKRLLTIFTTVLEAKVNAM